MFLFLRPPPSKIAPYYTSDWWFPFYRRFGSENISHYNFHSRPIRNRLIDTALLRLFCIFNYDRVQFTIFQLSPRRIANLQINRDFWYRIDSTFFLRSIFRVRVYESIQPTGGGGGGCNRSLEKHGSGEGGRIKLMTHKRVSGNRARRIVNFRRFDVAGVGAFSCGGRGKRAGLSQRSKSTKFFRGFICPSRMRRERARIHTCTISSQAGEYLWSFAEDEWEIGRESFVILCALFIWNASNVPPERRCFVTFLMIYLAFGGSYRLVPTIRFDFPLLFRTRSRKCSLLPPSFSSISIRSPRG